jgi:two-component system, cell cycle response regulator
MQMTPIQVSPRLRTGLRAFWALAGLALLAFVAHATVGFGGPGLDTFFQDWVYNGVTLGSALACLLRAYAVREERLPWLVMGIGLLAWTGGDLYWTFVLSDDPAPPYPSPGDALYLAFYPASYATLVLLARARLTGFRSTLWLDGAIAALAVGAFAAALAFPPIIDAASGNVAEVATNLAYPVGDLVLLGLVLVFWGATGWRPDRLWLLLGTGLALTALSDVLYLVKTANGTYSEGTIIDVAWPAAALLVALAAWQPPRTGLRPSLKGWRVVAIPFVCGLAASALLVADHFARINVVAMLLTAACLVLVITCMAIVFRDNQRILARTEAEALTDSLTGLRNRRSLMRDLEGELAESTEDAPSALLLFDLDGFKEYNDVFGHPAGDSLLARLGAQLAGAAHGHGHAYRLGGDEFCTLVRPGAAGLKPLVAACVQALSEHGDGFDVRPSHGAVLLPEEAGSATEALQLADRRMYARKGGGRMSAGRQTRDVLLRTLSERRPDIHARGRGVAELALATGRELGMGPEELDEVARAAELHDLGKIAVPDTILDKPGPLTEAEWGFMRRHTIVAERILLAAPALRPVARLVRSSHERWDGTGYPDALAGEQIPLGARVVAVCDAFDAMVSERPHRPAMTEDEALAELRACANSQFDAAVVEAFAGIVARAPARA